MLTQIRSSWLVIAQIHYSTPESAATFVLKQTVEVIDGRDAVFDIYVYDSTVILCSLVGGECLAFGTYSLQESQSSVKISWINLNTPCWVRTLTAAGLLLTSVIV
jgi:hypothetical protein